jgi:hypothetical protein
MRSFIGFCKFGAISKKKNIFWEIQLFAMVRDFKDGVTFFNLNINLDLFKSYHSPSFQIEFTFFNIYNHLWIHQNNHETEFE